MGASKDACAVSSPEARVAASPEVKLCDICGAAGYDEFLAVCTQCNERVEHVYCMQAICDSVPPNWVCEGCQKRLYNESCEEQKERLSLKKPFSSQEQNEQFTHGQEKEEVKEEPAPKIVPSEVFSISVSAEGALQAGPGAAKAGCRTVGCEIAPSQDRVDSERFHHGLKGLPSSKLPLCANNGLSKSNLSDSEHVPSFLLPSRPKELLRSNSRLSSVVANKKAGLPPDKVKVTADACNEHVRKQASLSASGLENSCQQSCRNFSHKCQGDMTVEAGWKCDKMNSSQVSHMDGQSKIFSGNQKDMFRIEAHKARQHANEEEAEVMETTSCGKTALSGSKQLAPEMRKSSEMVHAGTLEQQPLNVFKNGTLEALKPLPHGLLGVRPNFSSDTPRYCAPQFPVQQGGSHPLDVSNERQFQPHCFHQRQGRPWRPYGHQEFMPLPQSTNYACELNVRNVPPQLQAVPHVQKVWRGGFNVCTSSNCSTVYNGIQAHPSNKADPKVWEAAQSLPDLLKMKELKRGLDNNTWPQRFLDSPPTRDNIGMYFFPVNMESHDSWYKPLADRLIAYDLVLRAESPSLYLLIFHSQLFPKAEQLWDGRHYLWGVFRTKKSNSIQRASILKSALDAKNSPSSNANGEIIDMDIDMVGGADVQPSMALGRGLPLPPLPPGSPPAKPPPPPMPPHRSDEDRDVSLCSEGLPSAPPSPPPTPPQSQQEIVLESSCDLSAVPKHKPAAQQGACPTTSNILESPPGGEIKRLHPTPDFVDEIPFSKKPCLEGIKSDKFEILLDAAEPRGRENCSVSSLKMHDGQSILSNSSADGQPEQPSSHGDVTHVAKESIQPSLQTSEMK